MRKGVRVVDGVGASCDVCWCGVVLCDVGVWWCDVGVCDVGGVYCVLCTVYYCILVVCVVVHVEQCVTHDERTQQRDLQARRRCDKGVCHSKSSRQQA